MLNTKRVNELLSDLMDHQAEGSSASSFGMTDYDPIVEFPVCRRAVEELVSMGSDIIPRMLAILGSGDDVQSYFAAVVLGRLRAVEAIDPLEKLARAMSSYSRRVNYDQYIEYPVYEQAVEALLQIDKVRAFGALQSIAEANDWKAEWAKAKLIELN